MFPCGFFFFSVGAEGQEHTHHSSSPIWLRASSLAESRKIFFMRELFLSLVYNLDYWDNASFAGVMEEEEDEHICQMKHCCWRFIHAWKRKRFLREGEGTGRSMQVWIARHYLLRSALITDYWWRMRCRVWRVVFFLFFFCFLAGVQKWAITMFSMDYKCSLD